MKPALLIRLEHFSVFAIALVVYFMSDFGWWQLLVFFLVPDLGMLGYLMNERIGSLTYNLVHLYVWPIVLLLVYIFSPNPLMLQIALIWLIHISIDRVVGYGLKYPTAFKDTTAQRLE